MAKKFRTSTNIEMTYHTAGNGPSRIVFLHGLAGNHQLWKNQISTFSKEFETVTLDLPGHGESADIPPENLENKIARALLEFQHSLPQKPTHWVAHSWAGSVVNLVMENLKAASTLFVDSPCIQSEGDIREYREWGQTILQQEDPGTFIRDAWFGTMLSPSGSQEHRELVLSALKRHSPQWLAKVIANFPKPRVVRPEPVVHVIEGNQFFPGELHSLSWRNLYPSATHDRFPGAGHYYFLEAPETFNAFLKTHLRSIERKS